MIIAILIGMMLIPLIFGLGTWIAWVVPGVTEWLDERYIRSIVRRANRAAPCSGYLGTDELWMCEVEGCSDPYVPGQRAYRCERHLRRNSLRVIKGGRHKPKALAGGAR